MQKEKRLETLLVVVLGLCVLYWFKRHQYILIIAIVTGLLGLLVPAIANVIHYCWTKLSTGLGFISGKILLTVVFIFILIPLAFFWKRFGKNNMRIKEGAGNTFFNERNHLFTKEDLENVW
jgi:hypothetical protein